MEEIWFLDDEPSKRFPLYCRGNVGEIVPNVTTPLTSTTVTGGFQRAFGALFTDSGAFTEAELAGGATVGGIFGGYLYFNLSFARVFAVRVPGIRVRDIDQQMLGNTGAPPYERRPGDRSPAILAKATVGTVRSLRNRKPIDLDAARAEVEAWLASLPVSFDAAAAVALARGYEDRFVRHLDALLDSSLSGGLPIALLERLSRRAVRRDAGVLVRAISGIGSIETARPAAALWDLGRMVAASPALTAAFDEGVDGILGRISDPAFTDAFAAFLAEHGHRGPNEVELASDTWTTAPGGALAAVERLRRTSPDAAPVDAGRRLAVARDAARRDLMSAWPAPLRPLLRRLLTSAARGAERREQAKGTLVLGLSGLRRALFDVADRLVAEGRLADRRLLFMATLDELESVLDDPAAHGAQLEERRRRYEELDGRVPPFFFDGHIPPPDTWPLRGTSTAAAVHEGEVLTGIAAAAGLATGRARVILDPADPRGIEPGDVLIAPITDPAWTPLFLAAVAVVVDVGALLSHAAIVARELGIPSVVSVEGASARIADGTMLEVDGDRGLVRVISLD